MDDGSPARVWRVLRASLLVCLIATAAGCAAFGQDAPAGTPGGAAADTPTPSASPTPTPVPTTEGTATPGTESGGTTNASTPGGSTGKNVEGRMAVVVAGDRLDVHDAKRTSNFWFDANHSELWHEPSAKVTLAQALATFGIDAKGDSLTYQGTTYRDGQDGASVNVRVNGQPVDPTSYVLQDGDEVWVTVETPGMDVSTPGTYIHDEDLHVHGKMHVVVDGHLVNFSRSKYQSRDRYFHFEGGNYDPWHAHSYSLTLAYALGTLPGMDATANSVTYDNTTYSSSDPGTTVTVTVNGMTDVVKSCS